MIVNLKHLKKHFSDQLPPFDITDLGLSSPNPNKILKTFTNLQCGLQLLSLLSLFNGSWILWSSIQDDDAQTEIHMLRGNRTFFYTISLAFQAFDICVTGYASYHLLNASFMYNYVREVNCWKKANHIYFMLSSMFFIYEFTSKSISCLKHLRIITSCLCATYKVYILCQLYAYEKSSAIILEQNVKLFECSSKPTTNENSESSQSRQVNAVVVELRAVDTTTVGAVENNFKIAPIRTVIFSDDKIV